MASASSSYYDYGVFVAGDIFEKFFCGVGGSGGAGTFQHHFEADPDYFDATDNHFDAWSFCLGHQRWNNHVD